MTIEVIIYKTEHELQACIESSGFFYITAGADVKEIIQHLTELLKDYQTHEGANDPEWKDVDVQQINFDVRYDLQVFFEEFNYLKISEVAKRAGMNASLLRGYATGHKFASAAQAMKIENTLHKLAVELQAVSIYA